MPKPPLRPAADAGDPLFESAIASEPVYSGRLLKVYRDEIRLPDGSHGWREYIRHPGAVMVVPLLPDGEVVLERQFRYPHGRSFVEFPAGKLDPGEAPLDCAQRELLEEAGYRAARWRYLGRIVTTVAYSDERIEIFLAEELSFEGAQLDAGEHLEVFTADWRQVLDWTRDGTITDAKTVVGALWLEKVLAGQWPIKALDADG
jgi:ADP-ribose pyrophosphatase